MGSLLLIYLAPQTSSRTVTFKRKGGSEIVVLVRGDRFVEKGGSLQYSFRRRLNLRDDGLEISDLKIDDAGTYEFKDYKDNVIMTAEVKVHARE